MESCGPFGLHGTLLVDIVSADDVEGHFENLVC